jgi:hypothetical protein
MPKASSPRTARLALSCALVLSLVPLTVYADYKQDYGHALEAYKSGNFAEAQRLFAQAAAEHPEPAERTKLYGMRFEPYLPQHYLGLIAAQSGDCGRARAQWGAAGNADIVAKVGDASAEEKSAAAKCGGGTVAQNKPPAPAPTPSAPAPASPTTPIASTPQKPSAPAPAEPTRPVVTPPIVVANNKPSEPVNKPSPPEPPAEKPAPDKVAPPDQLVAAFDSFVNGRLGEVSRINPDAYADSRARFHAYLVRSGARFTLAQLGGDQSLLESARADARAAKTLNAGATPDAVLFSPRFRDFYKETR